MLRFRILILLIICSNSQNINSIIKLQLSSVPKNYGLLDLPYLINCGTTEMQSNLITEMNRIQLSAKAKSHSSFMQQVDEFMTNKLQKFQRINMRIQFISHQVVRKGGADNMTNYIEISIQKESYNLHRIFLEEIQLVDRYHNNKRVQYCIYILDDNSKEYKKINFQHIRSSSLQQISLLDTSLHYYSIIKPNYNTHINIKRYIGNPYIIPYICHQNDIYACLLKSINSDLTTNQFTQKYPQYIQYIKEKTYAQNEQQIKEIEIKYSNVPPIPIYLLDKEISWEVEYCQKCMVLIHFYCEWECRADLDVNWNGNQQKRGWKIEDEENFVVESEIKYEFGYYGSSSIFVHNEQNLTGLALNCQGKQININTNQINLLQLSSITPEQIQCSIQFHPLHQNSSIKTHLQVSKTSIIQLAQEIFYPIFITRTAPAFLHLSLTNQEQGSLITLYVRVCTEGDITFKIMPYFKPWLKKTIKIASREWMYTLDLKNYKDSPRNFIIELQADTYSYLQLHYTSSKNQNFSIKQTKSDTNLLQILSHQLQQNSLIVYYKLNISLDQNTATIKLYAINTIQGKDEFQREYFCPQITYLRFNPSFQQSPKKIQFLQEKTVDPFVIEGVFQKQPEYFGLILEIKNEEGSQYYKSEIKIVQALGILQGQNLAIITICVSCFILIMILMLLIKKLYSQKGISKQQKQKKKQ